MRLIILTTLFVIPLIGFASFPVFENHQENKSETITLNSNNNYKKKSLNIYAKISLALFALTVIFIGLILSGFQTFFMSGPTIAKGITYSNQSLHYSLYLIISFFSGVIFGIISLFKK